MSDNQAEKVRVEILNALSECQPFGLKETILCNQLNVMLDGIVDTDGLKAQLKALRELGLVSFKLPVGSEVRRWHITADGNTERNALQ